MIVSGAKERQMPLLRFFSQSESKLVFGAPSSCPSPSLSAKADFVGWGEGMLLQALGLR
jgi:hypothetical protein